MFNLIPWGKKKQEESGLAATKSHPLAAFRDEVDSVFDRILSNWLASPNGFARPSWGLDLEERDDEVVVKAELPGFDPKEIDVQVSGQLLIIKAFQSQEKSKSGYQKQSRRTYQETVSLPAGAKTDQTQAKYHNGILEVHIPRSEEARPKRIQVKA